MTTFDGHFRNRGAAALLASFGLRSGDGGALLRGLADALHDPARAADAGRPVGSVGRRWGYGVGALMVWIWGRALRLPLPEPGEDREVRFAFFGLSMALRGLRALARGGLAERHPPGDGTGVRGHGPIP